MDLRILTPSTSPANTILIQSLSSTSQGFEPPLLAPERVHQAGEEARVISPLLPSVTNLLDDCEAIGFMLKQHFRHYFIPSYFSEAWPGLSPPPRTLAGSRLRWLTA